MTKKPTITVVATKKHTNKCPNTNRAMQANTFTFIVKTHLTTLKQVLNKQGGWSGGAGESVYSSSWGEDE
jgi:hypothetical protein